MKEKRTENPKVKVLFVCLGNICRSPAAEGIMKKIVEKNSLDDVIEVDSAGTSGWHQGELPDERMRSHGQQRGYDFSSRSRKFKQSDFDNFNYIIVMDEENYRNISGMALTKEDEGKIYRMTDFSQKFSNDHIPDPYYGGSKGFELVLDLLEDACESLLEKIKSEYKLN